MAYHGGYAGGYADTLVPPAPPEQGTGRGGRYIPPYQPARIRGRAKIRLRVTILTWGAEAHFATRHTLAAAALTTGEGATRAVTTIDGDLRTRHAAAATSSRADYETHIGDPHEDDDIVRLVVAALLEDDLR